MKYAIIAAGLGSRLQSEGVSLPKPLVKLNGEAMIDRLARRRTPRVLQRKFGKG